MTQENPFKVGMRIFYLKELYEFYSSPFFEWDDYAAYFVHNIPIIDQQEANRLFEAYKKYLDHEQSTKNTTQAD